METMLGCVMTVKEVAEYLRVNQRTVYRLAVDRKLPGFKVGTSWRFERAAIDSWIAAQLIADGKGTIKESTGEGNNA